MRNIFEDLGKIALGSRIRLVGDIITEDARQIYELYGIKMNPKWFPVFYVLSKEPEQTITGIAKAIAHSHVSVSKIVGEMKKAKLITEKSNASDKRRTVVTLSTAGRVIAGKIENQYLDVQTALDEMSSQAANDLWKALEEWESLLRHKSLLNRVTEKKKLRESASVRIVPYESKYRQAFRQLNEEWIKTYFKMEQPDRDALGKPEEYILDKGGSIFVALLDNKPVGVCALLKRKDKHYPYELAKMAVAKDVRGKNIGFLLGQAVIAQAKKLNAKNLYLESNTILEPAIHLYHKLGFKKITGRQTPYERCNIQMEMDLAVV